MNNERRKEIKDLMARIDRLTSPLDELAAEIEQCKVTAEQILEEEQEALENMPESLHGSERYSASSAACDALDSAIFELGELYEHMTTGFGDIPNTLEEAAQ